MASNEVQLQLQQVRLIDTHVRQLAKASVDSIHRPFLRDDILDHSACSFRTRACFGSENNLFPAFRDVYDLLKSKLLTVEFKHANKLATDYTDQSLT